MSGTAWQDAEVARRFVEGRRAAIPYGADQMAMLLDLVRHFRPGPRGVVDLGCGDGTVARAILEAWPGSRALLLDYSEPMLERACAEMAPYADRCEIRYADLRKPLELPLRFAPVDLAVSGYAIHHLPDDRKRSLYAEVHALLEPGGLFINVEHVASATPAGEALFDERYIDHLTAFSGRPREQVARDYHTRPDRLDNILVPVETQLGWLREIGFEDVDCFFKWLELAVFAGRKAGTSGAD